MLASYIPAYSTAGDLGYVINLAGKQRMLTQKMSKEAALIALDVDVSANKSALKATHDLFDKTLTGLKNGDADLGLTAAKAPDIIRGLDKVSELWQKFSPQIASVAQSGTVSNAQLSAIAAENVPLLKTMNKAVKLFEASSSASNLDPSLAKAINLAGRQRMLTQKMSKEFFFLAKGYQADMNKAELAKTVALFDKTLNGLVNGDSGQGLVAAPSDKIKAQLEIVKNLWVPFKAQIESTPSDSSIRAVADNNLPLLKEMNKAVGLFEAFSKS